MNVLIVIVIIIAGIILIPLVIALFAPRSYHIAREIIINKPDHEVFDYIRYLKNQDHYSKWVMTDPNMKKTFTGTDGSIGFIYAWDSTNKNAGKGEQEIKSIIKNKRLDIEVRFEKPFKGVALTPLYLESLAADQTKLSWGMQGTSKYPMNIVNIFIDKMLGKDLEISLATLKQIMEHKNS